MEAQLKHSTPYASPIYSFFSTARFVCLLFFLIFVLYTIYICKLCQKKLDFPVSKTYS